MEQGSAFAFVISFIVLCGVTLLWVVLNETVVDTGAIMNTMTTDAETIARNNIGVYTFNAIIVIMWIVFGIFILRATATDRQQVVYQ